MNRPNDLILHVENDPDDVLLIRRALGRAGIENPVHVVENGEEAVRFLTRAAAGHDRAGLPTLILLDLSMPRMAGHDVLRWLREQRVLRRIPVIVLTSSNAAADIAEAYDAGANGYLVKPLRNSDLEQMFRDLGPFWFRWNLTEQSGPSSSL